MSSVHAAALLAGPVPGLLEGYLLIVR